MKKENPYNEHVLARRDKSLLLLSISALFLLFVYGAGALPLIGPDEPRYSQVARQMYESGDYIVPRLGEFPWFEKPVLLYWLMAISYAIFGVNEFAARFPSAVSALLTVLLTGFIVWKATDLRRGIATLMILGTCTFLIGFSHAATFDMLLTATIVAALTAFLMYELDRTKDGWLYVLYIMAGLAVLAKGFVALILIALALVSYYTIAKKPRELLKLKPITGPLLSILVMAIWFLPITWMYGYYFWDHFFLQHHLLRYTSSQYHRSGGLLFYLPVLLVGTFPWTAAPLLTFRKPATEEKTILIRFSLCWLISMVLFFSFSGSKLPGYILPAVPAFAILSGISLVDFFDSQSTSLKRLTFLLLSVNSLLVLALLVGATTKPVLTQPIILTAALVGILTLAALFLTFKRKLALAITVYSLIPLAEVLITAHQVPSLLNWYESKYLSAQIEPVLSRGKKLALYQVYDFSFVFYTNGRVELTPKGYFYPLKTYADLHRYASQKGEILVLVSNEELHWIQTATFWNVIHIFRGRERSVVQLSIKPGL